MKLIIVTGASQGLGEALVRRLLDQPDTRIAAISRQENAQLLAEAANRQATLEWITYDLLHTAGLEQLIGRAFRDVKPQELEAAYLINNAGIVQPIAPADRCDGEEIARGVQLNLIAPMTLTAAFLRHTADCNGDKAVLNVSSGAARNPYEGWSSYCSAKAGLDMFTRAVGLEQANRTNPVRILSVAPGVVDTGMQQAIRSTDPSNFAQHARFVALKEQGGLQSPDMAAGKLLKALFDRTHATGSLLDVRTLGD